MLWSFAAFDTVPSPVILTLKERTFNFTYGRLQTEILGPLMQGQIDGDWFRISRDARHGITRQRRVLQPSLLVIPQCGARTLGQRQSRCCNPPQVQLI